MNATPENIALPVRPPIPDRELSFLQFLRAIRTNVLTIWTERAYQDDVLVRRFFGRSHVLINAAEAIHRVLLENASNYRRSPASIRILRPITGNGLLLSEGEGWRHQRRTIAPALAPRVLPLLARHIVTSAQETIARLSAQGDAPVSLFAVLQELALDIVGRSMFSLEVRQYGPAMRRLLTEYGMNHARPHLFDILLPPSISTLRDLRRRRFQRRWMALIAEIMHARMAMPPADEPRDLFDQLLVARDPETGRGFSHEQLRDQVATMILAGHETTAVTMLWSLVLLAGLPEEQAQIAEEARRAAISPDGAIEAMSQLTRTRAVISETLRLYPPAFTLVREALGPDRLGQADIEPGAVVMIAPWVLHRHRRYWRDPDAFQPSRFMPGAAPPDRYAYLPFGVGPRVCIGAQFAVTEATLVIAMLVRAFSVALDDVAPMPVAIVTTQPSHPPMFRLVSRGSASAACAAG